MERQYNSKRAVLTYLSECTTLGEDIVYEFGGPQKQGFLSGLLETVNLPDVTLKPHRDLILMSGGVAAILGLSAIATAYIIKNR